MEVSGRFKRTSEHRSGRASDVQSREWRSEAMMEARGRFRRTSKTEQWSQAICGRGSERKR
jgi:hypothetical protein